MVEKIPIAIAFLLLANGCSPENAKLSDFTLDLQKHRRLSAEIKRCLGDNSVSYLEVKKFQGDSANNTEVRTKWDKGAFIGSKIFQGDSMIRAYGYMHFGLFADADWGKAFAQDAHLIQLDPITYRDTVGRFLYVWQEDKKQEGVYYHCFKILPY